MAIGNLFVYQNTASKTRAALLQQPVIIESVSEENGIAFSTATFGHGKFTGPVVWITRDGPGALGVLQKEDHEAIEKKFPRGYILVCDRDIFFNKEAGEGPHDFMGFYFGVWLRAVHGWVDTSGEGIAIGAHYAEGLVGRNVLVVPDQNINIERLNQMCTETLKYEGSDWGFTIRYSRLPATIAVDALTETGQVYFVKDSAGPPSATLAASPPPAPDVQNGGGILDSGQPVDNDEMRKIAEKKLLELSGLFFFEGHYAYRAIIENEWNQMRKTGFLGVSEGTQFEKEIGPQVNHYRNAGGYAGIVVRIPCKIFHFISAGSNDPQIVCLMTHNIKVSDIMVLRNKGVHDWVGAEAYLTGERYPSATQEDSKHESSAPGGIDFRRLPAVTQAISNLGLGDVLLARFSNVNLNDEQQEIERLVNAGIMPSAERVKEYAQASLSQGGKDIHKVASCVMDILRMQEERCCLTEPILKDILIVLENSRVE